MKAINVLIIIVSTSMIASCNPAYENMIARDRAFCQAAGAAQGPALTQCMLARQDQHTAAAAIYQQNINNALQQPRPVRVVNCNRNTLGVSCMSY